MTIAKSTGRIVAALLLVQMAGGPVANFMLLQPLSASPEYLESAAAHANGISLAVLIALAMGAATVGIAVAMFPIVRDSSETMALWLLAIAIFGFAVCAVESVNVLSMVSLSRVYATASAADHDRFELLAAIAASTRKWAHYLGLIAAGGFALVLYAALYRFSLIVRWLAAFGMVAALLEIVAVAMPLFGRPVVFPMLAPLGLAHLALAVLLLTKGFTPRRAQPT